MTIQITITASDEAELLEKMKAAGWVRRTFVPADTWGQENYAPSHAGPGGVAIPESWISVAKEADEAARRDEEAEQAHLSQTAKIDEIIEDIALVAGQTPSLVIEPTAKTKKRGRPPKVVRQPEVKPEPQDAEDEKAVASSGPSQDDIRAAIKRFGDKFGTVHVVAKIQELLGKPISAFDNPGEIADAVERIEQAIRSGDPSSGVPHRTTGSVGATRQEVVEAALSYGKKYGEDAMKADLPSIIQKLYGEDKRQVSAIPPDPAEYAKVLAEMNRYANENPLGRTQVDD